MIFCTLSLIGLVVLRNYRNKMIIFSPFTITNTHFRDLCYISLHMLHICPKYALKRHILPIYYVYVRINSVYTYWEIIRQFSIRLRPLYSHHHCLYLYAFYLYFYSSFLHSSIVVSLPQHYLLTLSSP